MTEPAASPPTVTSSHIPRGMLIGAILGYPLSYFFQSSIVRAKVSLPQYISHIGDILGDKDLRGAVFLGFIVSIAAGGFIGYLTSSKSKSSS